MHDVVAKFGFLLDVEGPCYDPAADNNDLKRKLDIWSELYSSDIHGRQLYEDILDSRTLVPSRANVEIAIPEELLEFIVRY